MSDEKLFGILKQLSATAKKNVDEGISSRTVEPQDEQYFKWKVEKFEYTEKGVTDFGAKGDYFAKKSWFRAIIKLQESIKRSNEYNLAVQEIAKVFADSNAFPLYLDHFVAKILRIHLTDPQVKESNVESLIAVFLKDLRNEPVKFGAEVELQGIALQPEEIEPSFGVKLRKTRIEDLEKEFPAYGFFTRIPLLPHPSAILKIDSLARSANEIQTEVERTIAILRLFKVGGVAYTVYRLSSESITDRSASGTVTSGRPFEARETYLISHDDEVRVKKFWKAVVREIPQSFFRFDAMGTDYLTIAYKRYSDALLENGLIERRITNDVMGLEALLLKPGELQELAYRLSVRISKLFELLGRNQYEVKKVVIDAYKVRNLFAHGGQLSYERKKKLEAKYSNVNNLLLSVLDCLRILIILMLFGRRGKNEFIDLLDDSLIDRKREEQLANIISQAKGIIG